MAKLIRYCFYLLFFLTPLVMTPFTFELFEFNKMMFVYTVTVVIAGAWAIESVRHHRLLFIRTPLDIPLALFLTSQILSTVFSIHPHTSLIGYYSRFNGGLFSTITYLILYYAFVTFRPSIRLVTKLLLTSTFLVSLYGIAEHFGIDSHLWVQDVQTRVFSTLGQPNWLAALLITVLPLVFISPSPIYYFLSAIYFLTLLYTKSRSGIIGFGVMYLVFWALTLLKSKHKSFPSRQFLLVSCILVLVAFIDGLRWLPQISRLYPSSTIYDLRSTPPAGGGTQLESGGSESGDIRKIVWAGAIRVWQHYPIFGSGVETFAYSYYNFRSPDHNLVSEWDFLYNKAHNEYLNLLATTGIVGLGTYLLFQLWFIVWSLKIVNSLKIENCKLIIALLAGLAGLSVSNFFGFSTVAVSLLFFLYPAMAVTLTQNPKSEIRNPKSLSLTQKSLIGILFLGTCFLEFRLGRWWYADTLFASGKRLNEAGYLAQAFPKLDRSVRLMPQEPTFRDELAQASAEVALALSAQEATAAASQAAELAVYHADTVQKLNPVHLNFVKTRARVMFTLAQLYPEYLTQAQQALERGIELSPTDPKLHYNLGLLYLQQDNQTLARQWLQQTLNLKPNYTAAQDSLDRLNQL